MAFLKRDLRPFQLFQGKEVQDQFGGVLNEKSDILKGSGNANIHPLNDTNLTKEYGLDIGKTFTMLTDTKLDYLETDFVVCEDYSYRIYTVQDWRTHFRIILERMIDHE